MRINYLFLSLFILTVSLHGQDFYGSINSVVLSDNRESKVSDYTIQTSGVVDANAGSSTSNSYLPAGSPLYLFFPSETDVSSATTITITTPSNSATVSSFTTYAPFSDLEVIVPFEIKRGESFILIVRNITNPPLNPLCGSPNTYYSSAPCDQTILIGAYNILGTANIYEHYGFPKYSIQPTNYFVASITIEKPYSGHEVYAGTSQNELVLVHINVKGSSGPYPTIQSISTNVTGSTNLTSMEYWYTGNVKTFHATTETLLHTENNPSTSFTTTTNQSLTKGDNYLWLVGSLPCTNSIVNNWIDASVSSLTISGIAYSPTNNSGARRISNTPIASTNLVSNPGFESYTSCPTTWTGYSIPLNNEIAKATGWNYLNPGLFVGTADYFNTCATGTPVHVPSNTFTGHQIPHGGNAYAGLAINGFFEYVTTQLTAPLLKDTAYVVSFYTTSAEGNYYQSNGIGALLSSNPISHTNLNAPIPLIPQTRYNPILYDQNDWVFVCDTFIAAGGERWLTLGGFESNATAQTFRPNNAISAYALIDDISLVKQSQTTPQCTSVALAFQQHSSETESGNKDQMENIEQVSEREFSLRNIPDIQSVELYSYGGARQPMFLYDTTIDLHLLTAGMYLLKVTTENKHLTYKIILH